MATMPEARSMPLTLPKVESTNPLFTRSKLASRTCCRSCSNMPMSLRKGFSISKKKPRGAVAGTPRDGRLVGGPALVGRDVVGGDQHGIQEDDALLRLLAVEDAGRELQRLAGHHIGILRG